MLTWNDILYRIKTELALPNQPLEKEDAELIEYCKRTCIGRFSRFFPDINSMSITTTDPEVAVPRVQGQYYVVDPDGRSILNVISFIPDMSSNLMLGHPYIGAFTFNQAVEEQALSTFQANNLRPFSSYYNYTINFRPPNILRVSPNYTGTFTIEYERVHSEQLETIPADLASDFTELCVSSTFMNIGRLRKRYQSIQTPFGEININGDDLFNEGQERYNALMDRFRDGSIPQVVFDRG